ncbi:MAG: hypothetical protein RLZZ524_2409, partial [Pseudomonadota bacterium]
MVWSERQVAMLAEMGIHLRLPTAGSMPPPEADPATVAEPALSGVTLAETSAESLAKSPEVSPRVPQPSPAVVRVVPAGAVGTLDPAHPVATMGWDALAEA